MIPLSFFSICGWILVSTHWTPGLPDLPHFWLWNVTLCLSLVQRGAAARLWVMQGACSGLVLAGAILVKRINAWLNFLDEDNGSCLTQLSGCSTKFHLWSLFGGAGAGGKGVRGWSNVGQTAT